METKWIEQLDLSDWSKRDLKDRLKDKKWKITIDNDEPMLTCPECECRMIARWYTLAVGYRGYRYCPYCGKDMKEDQLTIQDFLKEEKHDSK